MIRHPQRVSFHSSGQRFDRMPASCLSGWPGKRLCICLTTIFAMLCAYAPAGSAMDCLRYPGRTRGRSHLLPGCSSRARSTATASRSTLTIMYVHLCCSSRVWRIMLVPPGWCAQSMRMSSITHAHRPAGSVPSAPTGLSSDGWDEVDASNSRWLTVRAGVSDPL